MNLQLCSSSIKKFENGEWRDTYFIHAQTLHFIAKINLIFDSLCPTTLRPEILYLIIQNSYDILQLLFLHDR